MKWAVAIFLLISVVSCKDHTEDVDNAIDNLEWVNSQLDEIGERNIPGYKSSVYVPGINDDEHNDSIIMSEKEYREIQSDIYSVIKDLEKLSETMAKEYETE